MEKLTIGEGGAGGGGAIIRDSRAPKIGAVLRGNCCETCLDIPQKTTMNGFTKKNSLTRQKLFRNVCSNVL